ncbi:hypothetical protein WH96_04925 [Kiloniella spongiae]|uniref:Uncharacterized protein n=1 Tax=Kiloniella spongiae TaxID=1489064 RepID=A0A0H2MY84_9PROT|nr:hypothetical protein [Kiloniella spongiae]KLN61680.1 hypothetical protein WH96_04925 [Kiloniella spongiae]
MAQSSPQFISLARSSSTPPNIPFAKLELTYPYQCGKRIAAEFDARVTVGLEDNVLLLGDVDLFSYDDNHQGAYENCTDTALCQQIRTYVESSNTERERAFELLQQQEKSQIISFNTAPKRQQKQDFESFVLTYAECFAPLPD